MLLESFMFHLKGVEGIVLTWQDLAISAANLPLLWLIVFNRLFRLIRDSSPDVSWYRSFFGAS